MPLSGKSEAALVRVIAREGHSEIGVLALEVGLDGRAEGGNRLDRSLSLVRAIKADNDPETANRTLLEIAERFLRSYSQWQFENEEFARGLRRAFELDGYGFADGHLIPSEPGAIGLQPLISTLETVLSKRGYAVALRHYQQAVDNYVQENFEAANAQTRSFLEELFIRLCLETTGKEFRDASAALQHLRNVKWIDEGEWNHFRYLWADIQDNGPHRGLSSSEETLTLPRFGGHLPEPHIGGRRCSHEEASSAVLQSGV